VPRRRDPARLDRIVAAASKTFIEYGYERAKIHRIADTATISPGTIYLYVADKKALFELSLLRALESPRVAHPYLPYHPTDPAELDRMVAECLAEISHFPQLWVATQVRKPTEARREYVGILLEISRWIRRYHTAILIADRNQLDWPTISQLFERIVWADLHQRLTGYLSSRFRAGLLYPATDPPLVARVSLDALVAVLATGPLRPPTDLPPAGDDAVVGLLAAGVIGSGNRDPLPTQPR
jgi:AcrR family transcriptional regulator